MNCFNPIEGEPCNECEMCKSINRWTAIDVTELDAASHNSVDNIRDIIDDVQYPPQEAKYKVFIIDEVHMLSIGAVNAFLKTLEEPPSRVIFILATTDPQKLPITILSRCQRFDFKRISSENIFLRLKQITDSLLVDIEMVKGFKNIFFGGEGLFLTTLTGPGKVYLQTMPLQNLAGKLSMYLNTGNTNMRD